ncbi:non-heme iron oxygenase ferredoxin subunit [Caldichromatium japonicum]|uniref:Non-heme iron oxygenase ferredoxin subunit n=1 Tax=Caldichromatium japonicum TaxID=2699430 RepID=A0A6G7VCQ1_9GAMM|nr:non-heme iron oxygenase ferredoxin subunit [Caldichromatium japonicum]QIK37853.1 non-heme iron oxygenase ferredoxin subunit [Caldichromatium japonicum]
MADGSIPVADCAAIPEGRFIKVKVESLDLIIAHAGGRYYAIEDLCSHEDYPLSFGCLHGATIKCSLHGSAFDLASGQPLSPPAEQPIRVFPVQIRDEKVWVDPIV